MSVNGSGVISGTERRWGKRRVVGAVSHPASSLLFCLLFCPCPSTIFRLSEVRPRWQQVKGDPKVFPGQECIITLRRGLDLPQGLLPDGHSPREARLTPLDLSVRLSPGHSFCHCPKGRVKTKSRVWPSGSALTVWYNFHLCWRCSIQSSKILELFWPSQKVDLGAVPGAMEKLYTDTFCFSEVLVCSCFHFRPHLYFIFGESLFWH